jgi:anti-sigma B factor antagonist
VPDAGGAVPRDHDGPGLAVTPTFAGGRAVLRVDGEVDEWTSSRLLVAVRKELVGASPVAVDLSGVSFIGSAGLSALLQLQAHAERHRRQLEIVAMSATVQRAVELARLGHVLRVERRPQDDPAPRDLPPDA